MLDELREWSDGHGWERYQKMLRDWLLVKWGNLLRSGDRVGGEADALIRAP